MPRTIDELGYRVSDDVLYSIGLFSSRYGTNGYHDSGHTTTAPTWIFDFPRYAGAQVGIRMNKDCLTLYLRDKALSGQLLSHVLPIDAVTKRYPNDGKPAGSVARSAYLRPTSSNCVLLVNLARDDVQSVLDIYFGVQSEEGRVGSGDIPDQGGDSASRRRRNGAVSAEEFETQLNRRSEIGKAGEMLAVLDELERLRDLGCAEPEKYVSQVALTDVGRGYDIESLWQGEERYIEVKSSTSPEGDFFISDNERKTLSDLGKRAWLYLVHVRDGGAGWVTKRIQNPMNAISDVDLVPVVWRVSASALS